ncbi:GIY-YIG nuclease family protein [Salegentibacter mishustinae]|nr:GIY-YIG nuclease family protein [Salegentibacter mishustinae]
MVQSIPILHREDQAIESLRAHFYSQIPKYTYFRDFFMSKFHIYILFSEALNKYYISSTQDINIRLEKHLQSNKVFTSKAKDWVLVYSEEFKTRTEAIRRERQIKKCKSRIMIEKLFKK